MKNKGYATYFFGGGGEGANKVHYGKCGSGVLAGPIEQQVNRNTIMVTGVHSNFQSNHCNKTYIK